MKYKTDTPAQKATAGAKATKAAKSAKPAKAQKLRRPKQKRPALLGLLYLLGVGAAAGLLIAGYVFVSAADFVTGEPAIVLEDYKYQQDQTTIIYAYTDSTKKKTEEIARLHGEENRVWVPLAKIPRDLVNAFVALEDKRFYQHHGVDWIRTIGVMVKPAYLGTQGGSTITQQMIKNLTNEKEVTFVRKYWEILSALNLERSYKNKGGKDLILEYYLNTVYCGNGSYGVQTASEVYFGKDVWELDLAECAALCTITNAPSKYDPLRNPENTKKRQELALWEMLDQGYIDQDTHDKALDKKLVYTNTKGYKPKSNVVATTTTKKVTSNYVDYVIDDVKKQLMAQNGYTASQAENIIFYKGLKIYAAVDMKTQKAAEEVFLAKKGLPETDVKNGVQAAATFLDYQGRILAMVGQLGTKPGDRSLNRATTFRQPGSTIKPLGTYSPAIEQNLLYWSKLYENRAFMVGGTMRPHNYDGTLGNGAMLTVQYALQQSYNTIPFRIVNYELGITDSYNWLEKNMHLSRLDPVNDRGLAPLAIGAMTNGVNTIEMAAAYATFGNGGQYYKPFSFYKVTQTRGDEEVVLLENNATAEQVMKPETAELMRKLLSATKPTVAGDYSNARKSPVFQKTGTSDEYKNRTFALGFPNMVVFAWYGHDQEKTTTHSSLSNPAGILAWSSVEKVAASWPKDQKFKDTGNLVQKSYCTETGLIATDACPKKSTGWYIKSAMPATCSKHKKGVLPSIPELPGSVGEAVSDALGAVDGILGAIDDILH
jgi:penicillin-binding protein 1A